MAKSRLLLLQEDMALDVSSFDIKPAAITTFEDSEHEGQALRVETITTHSGMLINNRVYPGINMRKSVGTWVVPDNGGTAEYDRPVLLNHNTDSKPIGRVVSAKFTPLKKGNEFNKDFLTPVVIDRGKKSDDLGSGYITTVSVITDEDAIKAILRGEYKTVSSSFTTNLAICSICGCDYLATDKWCGHWPGETYEIEVPTGKDAKKTKTVKMFCFAITGDLYYREWSYVNVPADAAAQTTKMEKITLDNGSDECYLLKTYSDNAKFSSVTLCDTDGNSLSQELLNLGEVNMDNQAKETGKTIIAVNTDIADAIAKKLSDEPEVVEDAVLDVDDANQDSTPAGEDLGDEEPANSKAKDSTDADVGLSDDEFALANVARSMGTCLLNGDSSELSANLFDTEVIGEGHNHRVIIQKDGDTFYGWTYDHDGEGADHYHVVESDKLITRGANTGPDHTHEFTAEAQDWDIPDHETLVALVEKLTKLEADGKLSDAQQELLNSKNHCGPNRSFPVPDKDHVAASFRLLGRYKGRADVKSRIVSKVRKDAKDMGYFEVTSDTEQIDKGTEETVGNDQLLADWVRKATDLETQVASLKDQLSDKADEIKDLTDASVAVHQTLNTTLAHQLVVTKWILDKDDTLRIKDEGEFSALVDKYAERSPDSLRDSINDLVAELDIYLRDHRGGINKRILSTTQKKVEDDDSQKQVVKAVDKTNTKSKTSVKKSRPARKPVLESLGDDLAVE